MNKIMEEAVQFLCNGHRLFGIVHYPEKNSSDTVITMITGGPQTRFGGHRLYVQLARFLCSKGFTVLRFDYEGMGDSEGELVSFQDAVPSLEAAITFLSQKFHKFPKTILWTLCDGASISLLYTSNNQEKITGQIICNPYIINEERDFLLAHLRYHYLRRFIKAEFWKRLFMLKINILKEMKIIISSIKTILVKTASGLMSKDSTAGDSLSEVVIDNIKRIDTAIWFIFSTEDIIAMQFRNTLKKENSAVNPQSKNNIVQHVMKGADHTFTDFEMREKLFLLTLDAINSINKET